VRPSIPVSRRASGDPDAHGWEGAQPRHDLLAQRAQCECLAKHARDVDADCVEEPLQARRIVKHPILIRRDGRHSLERHAHQDVAAQRTRRVIAKVIAMVKSYPFQQQL